MHAEFQVGKLVNKYDILRSIGYAEFRDDAG